MPTVSNVNLTLTTVDANVTIHDYDGGDTPGAQVLDFYPNRNVLAVTVGNGSQVLHESESRTVSRASLQVDPVGNDDELKAVVRVHANQWLDTFTEDVVSDQEILLG